MNAAAAGQRRPWLVDERVRAAAILFAGVRSATVRAGFMTLWLAAPASVHYGIAQDASLALSPASTASVAVPQAASAATCESERGEPHTIVRISDADTAILDDGRDVRLAGLLFPQPPLTVPLAPRTRPPRMAAHAALADLTNQANIEIAQTHGSYDRYDRYGRAEAQFYIDRHGKRIWLQRALVEQGHAIVSSSAGGGACLKLLLIAEDAARRAKLGLWANAAYRIHDAAQPRDLRRLRSGFALVEGKVVSVTERSGQLYLNFGADWRTDFTVVVPKRLLKGTLEVAHPVASLSGHTIRVRGWIERRYGPAIELFDLNDLEDLKGNGTAAEVSPAQKSEP